jgi:hypothetical protein
MYVPLELVLGSSDARQELVLFAHRIRKGLNYFGKGFWKF